MMVWGRKRMMKRNRWREIWNVEERNRGAFRRKISVSARRSPGGNSKGMLTSDAAGKPSKASPCLTLFGKGESCQVGIQVWHSRRRFGNWGLRTSSEFFSSQYSFEARTAGHLIAPTTANHVSTVGAALRGV